MAQTKEFIDALLKEDLFTAKKIINERLLEKLGNTLEEKLVDFAPTVFGEATDKKKFAALAEPKDKITYADKIAGAKMSAKKKTNEELDSDEEEIVSEDLIDNELDLISEQFEQELASLVEEIESELEEPLTEEEIAELANELLDTLSEDESMEETEEEEKDEGPEEEEAPAGNRTVGGVEY